MKYFPLRVRFAVSSVSILLCGGLTAVEADKRQDLVTCGWDMVEAFRLEGSTLTPLWSWSANNSNLPSSIKARFLTTSDCKPYPDGRVIITSSGGNSLDGAVAVVHPNSLPSSNVLFYAKAPNAHSADFLPGNRIAVALSYHANGNRLAVYNLDNSDVEILSIPLTGAHGVIWDSKRKVLWALADTYINKYELKDWTSAPQLRLLSTKPLPDIGGHEMMTAVGDSPYLCISTGLNCWYFDRDTQLFTLHPSLGQAANVRGISTHPFTGRTMYVQADTSWWSERLKFKNPSFEIRIAGAHFYKARWLTPDLNSNGIDSGGGATSTLSANGHGSIGGTFATQAGSSTNHPGLIHVLFPLALPPPPYSIPVGWQVAHFGTSPVDPLADPDHDGTINFMEYLAGTDPLNGGSLFQPVGNYQEPAYSVSMPTVQGRNYEIWGSGDLEAWTLLETLVGDGGIKQFNFDTTLQSAGPISTASAPASHFFRVNITKQ